MSMRTMPTKTKTKTRTRTNHLVDPKPDEQVYSDNPACLRDLVAIGKHVLS